MSEDFKVLNYVIKDILCLLLMIIFISYYEVYFVFFKDGSYCS